MFQTKNRVKLFVCSSTMLLLATMLSANDFFSVSSLDSAILDNAKGTALLKNNVRVVQKSTGSTLVADELFLRKEKDSEEFAYAKAKGNVKVEMNTFDNLDQLVRKTYASCRQVTYDKERQLAEMKGTIEVVSHDTKLNADLIVIHLEKETGSITEVPGKQVHIDFYKDKTHVNPGLFDGADKKGLVEGQTTEIRLNRKLNKYTLQGNVRFYDHDEQALFTSQKADLFFNNEDRLEKIIAYQNVRLEQPKRNASADRADFNYKTKIITLTGNARLKETTQMEIKSSVIKMNMDDDKGTIESGKPAPVKMNLDVN